MGLTRKILLFTSLLVVALVTMTLAYTTSRAERLALASLDRALRQAGHVWRSFQADRYEKLKLGVRVLGNDPYFKAAVQTRDPETVRDLLQERGRDLTADFFVATDTGGIVIARSDRAGSARSPQDLSREPLVARPLADGEESASVWMQGDALFDAVSVPMRFGEEVVGVLVAGYRIDEELASEIHAFTEGEIAFVATAAGGRPRVLASTMGEQAAAFAEVLAAPKAAGAGSEPFELAFGGERYLAMSIPLRDSTGGAAGAMVVMRSLSREMAPFARFREGLVTVSLVIMVAALVVAWLGARRITGPLQVLVGLVERVRDGTYTGAVKVDSGDEIGDLAAAFDRMREGIAAREDQIRRMALQDLVTGLPNRALFDDRLQQALGLAQRAGSPVAVMVMGIDRFKDVNDTLGHQGGDAVLREVGARVAANVRGSDTVARLGGDQFAVLLPTSGAERARRLSRRLGRALDPPVSAAGQALHVGLSVGVASSPQHGADGMSLVRRAEAAMYAAKKSGVGFAVYEAAHDQSNPGRLWLVEELHQAIEEHQLTVHYQPKVELRTGHTIGVEALVRWDHPRRGLLGPAQFIPVAEQTGLIRAITSRVLDESFAQCGRWTAAGVRLAVSVNVSARDLMSTDLQDTVARLLRTTAVDPHLVCLEITESAVMEDPEHALGVLDRLRGMGLRLSIDDFGTGYSSLAYLKRLPVTEIKIDRAFVSAMNGADDDTAIVRATIELGHNMGLTVVAEGVEDEPTWQLLRGLGCDLAQGYYLSPPLPAVGLEAWLVSSPWSLAPGDARLPS